MHWKLAKGKLRKQFEKWVRTCSENILGGFKQYKLLQNLKFNHIEQTQKLWNLGSYWGEKKRKEFSHTHLIVKFSSLGLPYLSWIDPHSYTQPLFYSPVMASLNQLPEELLLAIFRHVPTSNLVIIGMVCKKWRRLATDFSLFHRLVIDAKMKQETVKKLLRNYTNDIIYIEVKSRNDTNELLPHLAKCSYLRSLKLISCQGQVSFRFSVVIKCGKLWSAVCCSSNIFSIIGIFCEGPNFWMSCVHGEMT